MFLFAATVSIDGKEYTGGMAKSKSAAAESAARLAAKLILDTNDECMLHIFRSKKKIVAATRSGSEKDGVFSCGSVCGHDPSCGNHACKDVCHPGPCGECELVPGKVTTCHCGKTRLQEKRSSCLDPIPTCDKACDKKLLCGIHRCKVTCHEGKRPPCLVFVEQRCRCGSSGQMVECSVVQMEEFRCNKPCGRKKNCGTHMCNDCCCPLSNPFAQHEGDNMDPHLCQIPCGKKLRCGQHSCARTCHPSPCDPTPANGDASSSSGSKVSCGQLCGVPRRECKHTCNTPCHPSSPCPDLRCEVGVSITCSCGRITSIVPCSAGGSYNGDNMFDGSIQQLERPLLPVESNGKRVPLGQRKLCCNEECAKAEPKRVLAESGDWTVLGQPPGTSVLGEVPGSEWRCADTPGLVMVKNRWTALESPAATSSGSADRLKLPPSTDAGSSSALAP